MIAEMRSYGQGVIVAEQIPTKLAPDVIKNSSNKIVQRLVAIDDQTVIANTIGISSEDSMQLGTLCTGKALCHKEGMSKPVKVDIIKNEDKVVTDAMLYSDGVGDRVQKIDIGTLKEAVGNSKFELTIRLLNSILIQHSRYIKNSIDVYRKEVRKAYLKNGVSFIDGGHERDLQSQIIASAIEQCLLSGTYKVKGLLSDKFEEELLSTIKNPTNKYVKKLRKLLRKAYEDDPRHKGIYIIAMLVVNQYENGMDIKKTVQNYFICPDDKSINEILNIVREG